ncbi:MAG: hypothetical protein HKM03_00310 [Steroidobacteraceae bacterium]|nr:hypothetical protein [Steroidobacteraceae bacterium]
MHGHAGAWIVTSVIDADARAAVGEDEDWSHPFPTASPRGTCLSLAASRSILDAHHGAIGHEHRAAGGARFGFRLPAEGA